MMSPPFKATQFASQLNSLRKKFPGNLWLDTEPGRQAIHEDFANGIIKATQLSLDLGQRTKMRLTIIKPFRS